MIDWKERYMREVEGLNNEGDPIGGDPPSGLRHQVEALKAENEKLKECLFQAQNAAIDLAKQNEAQAKRIAELEQKEKVLDRLINEFEGKHKFVGTRRVHKKLPLDLGRMENAETICAEHVDVYQWVFRTDGERSFKQAVMNLLSAKNGDSK